jgi:uncharacterized membrane protein
MEKKREPRNFFIRVYRGFMDQSNPRFGYKNLIQVIVGATVLAIPIAFTEETWKLGETLPNINVFGLLALSVLFVCLFAYRNYRKRGIPFFIDDFFVRVTATYVFAFLVVAIVMTLIQRAPWDIDLLLSIKRVIIVTFPASMSAAIADTISK